MRRTQSPETVARRERMRGIAKQISAMSKDQRAAFAARAPMVNPDGHALSVFNTCMVAHQFASATIIAGFRQWIRAGRVVRKGERGFTIWVPIGKGKEDVSERPGFILGTVFDVSQTDELTPQQAAAMRARERDKEPTCLLTAISRKGGIAWGEMRDITGESTAQVRPGLFRKAGNPLDDLATRLRDDGFAIPSDAADGGVQALRDMVQDELAGRRKYYSAEDAEQVTAGEYAAARDLEREAA